MPFDLKSYLKENDLEFHENRTHIILKNCPNCDGRDKLFIKKEKAYRWQCFKCKGENNEETQSGGLKKLLISVIGLDDVQADHLMKSGESFEYTPDNFPTMDEFNKKNNPELEEKENKVLEGMRMPSHFQYLDCSEESFKRFPKAYSYLISRKVFSKSIIKKFELHYDPINQRIVFPAYIEKGKLVGYQSRDITNRWKQEHPKCSNYKCNLFHKFYFKGESEAPHSCPSCGGKIEEMFYPKSINSKNFPKTEFFFNQQNVDWSQPVVLVEGPFDCINTPNSIGLLGKFLSITQLRILREKMNTQSLILFLDGDGSGTESTKDVYYNTSLFIEDIKVCPLDDEDDPGSHSFEDNVKKLSTCVNIMTWSRIKKTIVL